MIFETDQTKMRQQLSYWFSEYAHGIKNSMPIFKDSQEMLVWAIFELTCNMRDAIARKEGTKEAALFAQRAIDSLMGMANEDCLKGMKK